MASEVPGEVAGLPSCGDQPVFLQITKWTVEFSTPPRGGISKALGAAAIFAVAFSIGSPSYHSTGCQNRAKAESVVRPQREQTWRYAFTRSSSGVVSEG